MTSVLYDVPGPRARRRNLIGTVVGGLVLLALAALVVNQLRVNGIFEVRRWQIFWDPPPPFPDYESLPIHGDISSHRRWC